MVCIFLLVTQTNWNGKERRFKLYGIAANNTEKKIIETKKKKKELTKGNEKVFFILRLNSKHMLVLMKSQT